MKTNLNYGISASTIKELSSLHPWKSILIVIIEWIIIFSCILLHYRMHFAFVYFIIWIVISTRLYALYSLLHDAIHFSISRNKLFNDIFSQIFLGFPLFISINEIRKIHLAHHKHLQTEGDPEITHLNYYEFQFPKKKYELIIIMILDITGINFFRYKYLKVTSMKIRKIRSKQLFKFVLLAIAIFTAVIFSIADELILYWIIPYITFYQFFNRLRLSTEHINLPIGNEFKTRSIVPSIWAKFLLSPHNLGFHIEHHLFPGVPFYNLPKLHKQLMNNSHFYGNTIFKTSYKAILNEYLKNDEKN